MPGSRPGQGEFYVAKKARKPEPVGFSSKDDRLENDPRFLKRVEQARESLRTGRGVRLEDVKTAG